MMKLRRKRKEQKLTKSTMVRPEDLYYKFREEHPDSMIHITQFCSLIGFCMKGFADEIADGNVLNMGHRLGKIFIKKVNRKHSVYVVDKEESAKIKKELYGCHGCDRYEEVNKVGRCKDTNKNIFVTICKKNPTLLSGKNNRNGIKWVVPYVDDYYYRVEWERKYGVIGNKMCYYMTSAEYIRKKLGEQKRKEELFNNK